MNVDLDIDFTQIEKIYEFLESAERANGVVMFTVPYAVYVEYPTEYTDKKPPFKPIFEWVKRNINTQDPKGTAYAVRESIFKNGTDGVYFMTDVYEDLVNGDAEEIIRNTNVNEIESIPELIVQNILENALSEAKLNISERAYDTGALEESGIYNLDIDIDKF